MLTNCQVVPWYVTKGSATLKGPIDEREGGYKGREGLVSGTLGGTSQNFYGIRRNHALRISLP